MQEAFTSGKRIRAELAAKAEQEQAIHEIGENLIATARKTKDLKPRKIGNMSFSGETMPLPGGEPDEPVLYAFIGVPKRVDFWRLASEALSPIGKIKVAVIVDMYDHETWSQPGSRPFNTNYYLLTDTRIYQHTNRELTQIKEVTTTIALFQDIMQQGFYHNFPKEKKGGGIVSG